jgi:hypothetical protein
MRNSHICPRSHNGNCFHLKMFYCCVMDIEWKREGVMIIKEGVVFLKNVGIRSHGFKLLLKIAEIAKILK